MKRIQIQNVSPGDVLLTDAGFTCVKPYALVKIKKNKNGLYFECKEGKHYLEGQVVNKAGFMTGLTAIPVGNPRTSSRIALIASRAIWAPLSVKPAEIKSMAASLLAQLRNMK